ncbi:MAG TPA: hypothetical protein VJ464_28440 [Blastocatellia bacterium]|nr:hypothetical protein [Blastocatellia bacterium]
MQASVEILSAQAGEAYERDFLGEAEVLVRREGHSRARHLFTVNGRTIARLRWRGQRRAVYEAEGLRFYIDVGALDKKIALTSEDGGESVLVERSRANPHRAGLRVEMAEGDNFRLLRARDSRLRSAYSFSINKPFYASTLMVFHFDASRRMQTTARIEVKPVMKWEARFVHRLLALVVCRIILERRHSGTQPRRGKERLGDAETRGHGDRRYGKLGSRRSR